MIADFTCRVMASLGFFFLGIGSWIQGESSFAEIFGDLRFLWGAGDEGDIYYGVAFDD